MKLIKNWIVSFINLFFPSIAAYRTYDKDIIEYIENSTLVEMNCKRIVNLSWIFFILPIVGIFGFYSDYKPVFYLMLPVALFGAGATVFACIQIKKALSKKGEGILSNIKHFEKLSERFWITWTICMLLIGFSKLNAGMNGSYLYLTQLCLAFLPLISARKMKKIGIFTAGWGILLAINLLFYGTDPMFISIVGFIISNMILVFISSYILQKLNVTINVMIAYVRMVGFLDQLTGIYNRRGYSLRVSEQITSPTRVGVIMMDIDYFKKYNDTFGHIKGDEILKVLASTIKHTLDLSNDLIVRYGGEEFAIICINNNPAETREKAEMVKDAIAALKIPAADTSIDEYLTVSMGISETILTPDISIEDVVAGADSALYIAKESGRNRILSISE